MTGNFATLAGRLREVAAALDGREEIGDGAHPSHRNCRWLRVHWQGFVLVKIPTFSLLFSLLSKIRFAGSTLPTTRDREGHRGPTWSRRSTILLRRAGDRRLGLEHGSVLARLKQPCARQSRGRSRLVADPALGHAVDRQRTHLGLGSHLQGVLLVKILIFSLLFSFVSRMKFCGSTLARTP